MSEMINIFIAHSGDDENYIDDFKALIGDKYTVRDSSLTKEDPNAAHNPEYIKSLIRSSIDWAGTVVVLIGEDTHTRDWVSWEIEYALKHGKNIVGVYLPGVENAILPEAIELYSNSIASWNSKSILDAINGNSVFENSDGTLKLFDGDGRATC
ncbi:hypothetical protein C1878_13955 [Gordonibacter sp. 28C]|uniref:TIR domain-containing protein n=1 Tax=Gordonibacter sp. 28C TaxID=2078569 RepID=UPI000DF843BB|nr:TIR domain-containing protein [Gordonibacter sp. 28C]RDB60550.1 hypothetical protein C1878_13955 [Gordonibacter sp. 28C]